MTTKMAPNKVIECQADLKFRLDESGFQRLVSRMMMDQIADGLGFTREMKVNTALLSLEQLRVAVRAGYAYHVNEEMTRLVVAAANALEDDDLFDPSLAPTGCGIVRFDGGLPLIDSNSNPLRTDWLVWSPASTQEYNNGLDRSVPSTAMWTFNDALDNPDSMTTKGIALNGRKRVIDLHGRWAFHGMVFASNNESLGPARWNLAEKDPLFTAQLRARGERVGNPTNLSRYLHAFWLLMGQKITVTSTRPPGHPAIASAAKRAKIARQVTVVELRRREYVSDLAPAPSGRTYDHRWVVRGFWRWQPYGPGRKERRRIWIDGYVKGPDGAPLIVRDQVYALRR